MGEKRKTAIYLRISTEDAQPESTCAGEGESLSISHQRSYLLEYIRKDKRLAGSEVMEFCDDGFTGTNMERPGMQKMLEAVRQNRIGCILVKDISRFSRNYIEAGSYLNQVFPFMGVDFISINDGYDSREQNGMPLAFDTAFQTLVYDLYSKDISVKIKSSIDSKYAAGEYVSRLLPLGYEKDKNVKNAVIVNEREAEIVRYVFSMAADGMTTQQIAKRLFEERVPTATQLRNPGRVNLKENHTWSQAAVRNILDNRFYLGEMAYGKTVRKSVGSKSGNAVPKSDWKVIKNHHEPLVTPEIFACVAQKRPGNSTRRKREKHPLTGKIYCGGCGYSLNYKPLNRKTPRYFWCWKHSILQIPDCCTYFNAAILEETVLTLLNQELMRRGDQIRNRGMLGQFQKEILEELGRKKTEYGKQYHEIQKERDALYEGYAEGQMDAKEYRERIDRLTRQMGELSGKIQETEAEYSRMKGEMYRDKQDMKQIIRCSHMETLTQEVVDVFIRKVTLYKDKRVEIEWNFTE
nr:recombinase family protein [uncultured Acetatifactor sp.]